MDSMEICTGGARGFHKGGGGATCMDSMKICTGGIRNRKAAQVDSMERCTGGIHKREST